jgi:hypothetical protein
MNKLKKKSLYLALVAGLGAAGIAGTASAVNINQDGLGQVLIYPYYTVRGGMNTYVSVTNTTSDYKAVKVRFTEGKNSREVKDFNLYLSPNDMWTAALSATANGTKLTTDDKSCTSPAIPAAGTEFVNYGYSGATVEGIVDAGGDGETTSLDRTREGYFEIIEMGTIINTADQAAILHTNGVPGNCSVVQATSFNASLGGGTHAASSPTGGLAGNATLIDVANGTDYGYDPVVLDNFSSQNIWFAPGTIRPDLTAAFPPVSNVYYANTNVLDVWQAGTADAVTALLMHTTIINDYVLDAATLSGTDWVITQPTKRYYVPVDDPNTATSYAANPPYTKSFWTNGACEQVSLGYFDREEQYVSNVDFSPPPPEQVNALCWETTIVTFNDSNVLYSSNSSNIPVNFEHGWAAIGLSGLGHALGNASSGDTYVGLPVVGFMVQDFVNGNVGGVLANYGGSFVHKYETFISVP